MKKILSSFAVVCFAALTFTSCTKDAKEATANVVPVDAMSKIQKMGFSTDGVQKVNGGYLVEGDIKISDAELNANPTSPNLIIANEEQYRTFNLVSATKHPVIKVALNNSSTAHEAAFSASLDEAI